MKRRSFSRLASLFIVLVIPAGILFWGLSEQSKTAKVPEAHLQNAFYPLLQSVQWGAKKLSDGLQYVVTSGQVRDLLHVREKKIILLETENAFLREQLSKYRRLDAGASIAEAASWKMIEGSIISYSARRWTKSIVVNRGHKDGVDIGDPVFHMKGLAGVVVNVENWSSTIQLLNDPKATVGVIVEPDRARGVVKGNGSSDFLEINLGNPAIPLHKGQKVITSGMTGSLYPSGLLVGTVGELDTNRFGEVTAKVEPAVAFEQIEEVLILKARHPEVELPTVSDTSATLATTAAVTSQTAATVVKNVKLEETKAQDTKPR